MMSARDRWYRQFSCPQEPSDASVFEAVVAAQAGALTQWLLDTHGAAIEAATEGVVELLRNSTREPLSFETAWHPAYGRAHYLFKSGELDPADVAVRLALRLTETGYAGEWSARSPLLHGLRIGPFVADAAQIVAAECTGEAARIRARRPDGPPVTLERQGAGAWQSTSAERLVGVGKTRSIYLLPAGAAADRDGIGPEFHDVRPVVVIDEAMSAAFQAAVDVVAQASKPYLTWIERVLRGILVCVCADEATADSGSTEDWPGIVHASYPLDHMSIAEILVHECSHQYFYLAERIGALADDSDAALYWSPAARRMRPLTRILTAYHALANVRLFYQACREAGVDDGGYLAVNEAVMDDAVAQLDTPLRRNPALTPLGRAMYAPLAERIAAL